MSGRSAERPAGRPRAPRGGRFAALAVALASAVVVVTCGTRRARREVASAPPAAVPPSAARPANAPARAAASAPASAAPAAPTPSATPPRQPADASPEGGGQLGRLELSRLHAALRALARGERATSVRILWLGDSHTAADFWSGRVRTKLQARFGDGGPGFVHLGYRGTRHDGVELDVTGTWRIEPRAPAATRPSGDGIFGLGGVRTVGRGAAPRATVTLSGAGGSPVVWELRYRLGGGEALKVELSGGPRLLVQPSPAEPPGTLRAVTMKSEGGARLEVEPTRGEPELFGLVVETERPGVVLDAVGINGARLATALAWNEAAWIAEVARRAPQAFFLAFGTNEAADRDPPERYAAPLARLVERVRRGAPDAACLVIAPPDSSLLGDRVEAIAEVQRRTARELGCGYWSAREAMGGRGAFTRWAEEQPPRASPDGLHLTPRGYHALGDLLAAALLADYERPP